MRGSLVLGSLLAACASSRVTAVDGGAACSLCGGSVAVRTLLAAGTPLSAEECHLICDPIWCGQTPNMTQGSHCELLSGLVLCDPTAADCGAECDPFFFNPDSCGDACGTYASPPCCKTGFPLYCRGLDCSACPAPDPRCSLGACQSFMACGGELAAAPRAGLCADADGGVDPSVDVASYCPDACNAMQAGAVLYAGCTDAGAPIACTSCTAERDTCEQACPKSSFRACMDCSARCGISFARCDAGC